MLSGSIDISLASSIPCLFSNDDDCQRPPSLAVEDSSKGSLDLHHEFKLPILHLSPEHIHTISPTVQSDLELVAMYNHLAKIDPEDKDTNDFALRVTADQATHFTSDVAFLRDTQDILSRIRESQRPDVGTNRAKCTDFLAMWSDVKECEYFVEKHGYMDWSILEYLNYSEDFLLAMCFINLSSPVASLLLPLVMFVLPFFLLKLRGIDIGFAEYLDTLREISKHHFIGKMLNIRSFSPENLMYIVFMVGLYGLQMYNNITSCVRFYHTIKRMNTNLYNTRLFIDGVREKMEIFLNVSGEKATYTSFNEKTQQHFDSLSQLSAKLSTIEPFRLSLRKTGQLGYMSKCYYEIHKSPEYEAALRYAVGFDGYFSIMSSISQLLQQKRLNVCSFDGNQPTKFGREWYVGISEQSVANDCDLSSNMVITGVNASGKTTYLKSVALNIIFSQQFGCGCYATATINPYTHIHSYLNIPDTSGRDSLFQAESRRCKEILDAIRDAGPNAHHFCLFDELYSGTNPDEATKSATAFLKYLATKWPNVDFILTTHYVKVCKKIKKIPRISNFKMVVLKEEHQVTGTVGLIYTYKIKPGISKMHGGVEILKQMNYPEEMLRYLLSKTTGSLRPDLSKTIPPMLGRLSKTAHPVGRDLTTE